MGSDLGHNASSNDGATPTSARFAALHRYMTAPERADAHTIAANGVYLEDSEPAATSQPLTSGRERNAGRTSNPGHDARSPRSLEIDPGPVSRQRTAPGWLSSLAAIVAIAVLLGGFLALFARFGGRGGSNGSGPCSAITGSTASTASTNISAAPPSHFGPNTAYAGPVILAGTQDGYVAAIRLDNGTDVWHWGGCQTVDALVRSADIVYIASHPASLAKGDDMTRLTALRVRDGSQLWQATEPQLQGYTYMALDGNALVVASNYGDGTIYGLDARSSQTLWTYTNRAGRTGLLITATGGIAYIDGISQGFTALDDRTGKAVWSYSGTNGPAGTAGTNGPTIVPASGRQLVYYYRVDLVSQSAPSTPSIIAFDAASGAIRETLTRGVIGTTLLVTPDGIAYTAGKHNQLCALRIADVAQLWCAASIGDAPNPSLRLAPACGSLFYSRITNGDTGGSPVEVGALDPLTGAQLWTWQGDASLYFASNAMSLACDQSRVYLATRRGLYAFQPSTGHRLWQALPGSDFSFIQPALAD